MVILKGFWENAHISFKLLLHLEFLINTLYLCIILFGVMCMYGFGWNYVRFFCIFEEKTLKMTKISNKKGRQFSPWLEKNLYIFFCNGQIFFKLHKMTQYIFLNKTKTKKTGASRLKFLLYSFKVGHISQKYL